MIRILVADDDAFSRRYLEATLRGAGWSVETVADGLAAWSALERPDARFDILITDVRMPGLSGIDLIARIRERAAAIGIIAVSAMGSDEQIVAGLEAGADDYLAKPVSSAILLAKVRAALRRAQGPGTGAEVGLLEVGPLRMDRAAATVTKAGHPIALTRTEYELLAFLMLNRGRIVSPTQILATVWGEAYESDTEILRAAIVRLRRKIEDDPAAPALLRTHIGFGYSLGMPR